MKNQKQKYHKGGLVHVAKFLGSEMSHFKNDCDAIIIGSYRDQFVDSNDKSYTLFIKDHGEVSWYEEHQLELIERNRNDLLVEWKAKIKKTIEVQSNLDWIFNNGPEIWKSMPYASIVSLAKTLGIYNMWGSRGEGFAFWENSMYILMAAEPYLKNKDKEGWLEFCDKFKKTA